VRLSRRRLLLLLDNLLISETEPSNHRLPGAAGECNSSVPKNAFTIQIEIRIQKKKPLQNQAASLEVCSALLYKSLLQTKKPKTKHQKLSYDCKTELA
jgi:hypothetical protein